MDISLNLAGVVKESIVDGPGFRYVVFAQGCPHHCEGCHNPETHDFGTGFDTTPLKIIEDIERNSLISGITLSGGEPFCQPVAFAVLAKMAAEKGISVITYTGYLFEELIKSGKEDVLALLKATDILVDGPFLIEQKTLLIKFRGSKNQRIIDVKKSLEANTVITTDF